MLFRSSYGFAHYQAKSYDSAIAVFGIYKQKYPDEVFGYLWSARANNALDSNAEKGAAMDDYVKLIEVAKKADSVKYKALIIESYFYLAGYSNNVKKDKPAAIDFLQKVLDIDPNNATAKQYIDVLSKPTKTAPPKQPAAKPKAAGAASR